MLQGDLWAFLSSQSTPRDVGVRVNTFPTNRSVAFPLVWSIHLAEAAERFGGRPVREGEMVYVEFTVWLLLIVFCSIAVYRLWTGMVRPAWVNWVLLPGTVVSEMAYIFGCLITGRQTQLKRRGGK